MTPRPPGDRRRPSRTTVAGILLLAVLAYVPTVLTARGVVPGDTKLYLYLDPGRLIGDAASLWDARQFGGWVTHQTVGYLWPTGPWYWLFDQLGAPDWLAQRLWLGTLFLAAGTGMWWCTRRLGLGTRPALVAAVVFQLSPYVLPYVSRTSALLLPWAGLGWLVGLTVSATRRGGWRDIALAGLVVATVGGLNATALAMIAPAPVLWLLHAGAAGEVPWRRVGVTAAKLAGVSLAVSAWWLVPLAVQARFGADVLAYSETIEAVATTSLAPEVLRGLGYWLFYGGNVIAGDWTGASTAYLQSPGLMALGLAIVAGGFAGLVLVRWRHRTFAVACIVVGVVLAVGAHPTDDPSPLGSLLADSSRSTVVLALRSSTRAVPLVVFGLALGLAAGVAAVARIDRRAGLVAAGATGLVAVAALPPLWTGGLIDPVLRRPEELPGWWTDAAAALDADPDGGRVLELPGTEFAVHRWGDTVDPILPGLIDRPTIARDLLPLGSPAAMDLLYALDDRFQDGAIEPGMIAPVARLLGATDILHRGDVAYERFQGPRPEETWTLYEAGLPGLGAPETFGEPVPNVGPGMLDETTLSSGRAGTPIPPLALVPVDDPVPVVRAVGDDRRVVLVGSGSGVVDAAAAGVIDGSELLRYAASAGDEATLAEWADGAALVLTDSNRREARQWRGSQETRGYTEADGTAPLEDDPADHRLTVFEDDAAAGQTVARQEGGLVARATAYGSPVAYRPEARAWHAVDGDTDTAWLVGDRGPVVGERLRLDLPERSEPASVTLVQPPPSPTAPLADRAVTAVRVRTEAGELDAPLDASSRTPEGQTIAVPPGPTEWIELEILADSAGERDTYFGVGPAGFAEVRVDGIGPTDEVVELPAVPAGTGSDGPLAVVLTRWRVDARKRWRDDPEAALVRAFTLPRDGEFALRGTARLSPRATDDVLRAALAPDAAASGVAASASGRMAGVRTAWGRAALDGDPGTAWTSPFGQPIGASITVTTGESTTLAGLDLEVVDDDRHSVPTELTISNGAEERRVAVPRGGGPVAFPALTGDAFTVTVSDADVRTTVERRTEELVELPVAIAELGLGVSVDPLPESFDTGCRDDLITIDGQPAPVRVSGAVDAALAGQPLDVAWCGIGPGPVLDAGRHELRAAPGRDTGIDIDQLVLTDGTFPVPTAAGPELRVDTETDGPTATDVTVEGGDGGFWLVFGQGHNDGWRASWDGTDLGDPQVVDGGMNGWWVPRQGTGPATIELRWEPQRIVRWGFAAGAIAVVACAVVAAWPRRRRAAETADDVAEHTAGEMTDMMAEEAPDVMAGDMAGDPPEAIRHPLAAAPPLTVRSGIVVVALTTVVAWFVIGGWWALAGGVVAAVAAFARHGRRLAGVAATAAIAGVGVYYALHQLRVRPLEGFGWVTNVEVMHRPALLAVVLLGTDALIGALSTSGNRHIRWRG